MKNNYETPDVIAVGEAQDIILGNKLDPPTVDSIFGAGFRAQVDSQDIDESDE